VSAAETWGSSSTGKMVGLLKGQPSGDRDGSQGTRVAQLHHVQHRGGTASEGAKSPAGRRGQLGEQADRLSGRPHLRVRAWNQGLEDGRSDGLTVLDGGRNDCSYAANPRT